MTCHFAVLMSGSLTPCGTGACCLLAWALPGHQLESSREREQRPAQATQGGQSGPRAEDFCGVAEGR